MPTKFYIRPETSEDNQEVSNIIKRAFEDGERGYTGEAELVEKLRTSKGYIPGLSVVAKVEVQVIGHIMLSRVYIIVAESRLPTLILAPISVHPAYQNQGVGSALIKEVHRVALKLGEKHIFLLGHKAYYPKFGYIPSCQFGITFPERHDDDHCMGIELVKGSLDGIIGTLEYSRPFYEI